MSIIFRQSLMLGLCLFSSSWALAAVKEYHLTIDEGVVNVTGKPLKQFETVKSVVISVDGDSENILQP